MSWILLKLKISALQKTSREWKDMSQIVKKHLQRTEKELLFRVYKQLLKVFFFFFKE